MSTRYFVGPVPSSAEGLLYNSYIKSLWDTGGMKARLTYSEHCRVAHDRLEGWLRGDDKPILLALLADLSPEWVGGWLIAHRKGDALYVHWVWVRHPFRRQGYATALLDAALTAAGEPERIYATHDHPRWRAVAARKGIELAPLSRLKLKGTAA